MSRLRPLHSIARLVVLIAFVVPPLGPASMGHAMSAERASAMDCPDHAPPPDPCPEKGTAKHVAGDCCPLMATTVALLPPAVSVDGVAAVRAPAPARAHDLAGCIYTKDPPPPRV
jgi:hypothetical protein